MLNHDILFSVPCCFLLDRLIKETTCNGMDDHLQSRVTPCRQYASHVKVRGTLSKMDLERSAHWRLIITVIVQNADKPSDFFNYRLQNGRLTLQTGSLYRSTKHWNFNFQEKENRSNQNNVRLSYMVRNFNLVEA